MTLGNFADRGGMMLAMMIYARILEKTEYGILLMALTTVNLFTNSLTSGPNNVLIREVARGCMVSPQIIPSILRLALKWFGGVGVVLGLLILILSGWIAVYVVRDSMIAEPLRILAPLAAAAALGYAFSGILQGLGRFPSVAKAVALRGLICVVSAAILGCAFGLSGAAAATVVTSTVFALVTWRMLSRTLKLTPELHVQCSNSEAMVSMHGLFVLSAPLMLMAVVQIVADLGSQALLARDGQRWAEVADLNVARQLTMILPMLSGALAVAAMPAMSASHAAKDQDACPMTATYLQLVWISQVPVAALIFGAAPLILVLLYGENLHSATDITRLLVVSCVLFSMTWTAGPILISRGRTWTLLVAYVVRSAMILAVTQWLLPRYGIIGVGIAYIAGEAAAFVLLAFMFARSARHYLAKLRPALVGSVPMLAGMFGVLFCDGAWGVLPAVAGVSISAWFGWQKMDREIRDALLERGIRKLPALIRTWLIPAAK